MNGTTILKKIAFAPLFLIFIALTCLKLTSFLQNSQVLFSLDQSILVELLLLTALIIFTGISFVLFAVIANDLRIVIPIIILSLAFPLIFFPSPLSYFFAVGISICFILSFFIIDNKLNSYLTFQPSSIFAPPTKQLIGFMVLIISFVYFLSISQVIKNDGFQIPDSLIDASLKLTPMPDELNLTETTESLNLPPISQEQIDLLRQNPQLLKESGLDPSILDSFDPTAKTNVTKNIPSPKDLIKQTVKQQVDNMIKPYINYIPAFLAIGLFLTLKSFAALLSMIVGPVFWLIFYLLEKTGFVNFTTEMREVKKLTI